MYINTNTDTTANTSHTRHQQNSQQPGLLAESIQHFNIASYNCYNFKASFLLIQHLIATHHIVFIAEHWLAKVEAIVVREALSTSHNLVFISHFSLADGRLGRPHGGLLWLVDPLFVITRHEQLSERISLINVTHSQTSAQLVVIGVWLNYDDGSRHSADTYWHSLTIISETIKDCRRASQEFVVVGDWNSDIARQNRFDDMLREFIRLNELHAPRCRTLGYTYKKGEYLSAIDYAMVSAATIGQVCNFTIVDDARDTSDHKPISISLQYKVKSDGEHAHAASRALSVHRFNWKDPDFIRHYKEALSDILHQSDLLALTETDARLPLSERIDAMYTLVCRCLLKAARKAESLASAQKPAPTRRRQLKQTLRSDRVATDIIKELHKLLDKKRQRCASVVELNRIIILKRALRRRQREMLFEKNTQHNITVNRLFKVERTRFWTSITKFRRQSASGANSVVKLADFEAFYKKLFCTRDDPDATVDDRCAQIGVEQAVRRKCNALAGQQLSAEVTRSEVEKAVASLKCGKTHGHDGVANEMLIHSGSSVLFECLAWMYESILTSGLLPTDFNISVVCPIPKAKVVQSSPGDFRPISVSSSLAIVFEALLLNFAAATVKRTHSNQFGYRAKTSCKHAYFVLNETIRYYNHGGSSVFIASLDAEKAFDSLWRCGLFYKLIGKLPDHTWRALVNYYEQSRVRVRLDGQLSDVFSITGGVKQGGILSPFLFNFFIDDLIRGCDELNIGCKLGRANVCILAYCDDIVLVSANREHLNRLLKYCEKYSLRWKMRFNGAKSTHTAFTHRSDLEKSRPRAELYGNELTYTSNFVYLGLPVGDSAYIEQFLDSKIDKCCRAFHSLNRFGCKANGLAPKVIASIFKTYCQPIVTYCVEALHIGKTKLKAYDSRQATLVKTFVGLSKYASTTPLLHALRINTVSHLYYKMKLVLLRQLANNRLTNQILGFLRDKYKCHRPPKHSVIKQLEDVSIKLDVDIYTLSHNACSTLVNSIFVGEDDELTRKTNNICILMGDNPANYAYYRQILKTILSYDFGLR